MKHPLVLLTLICIASLAVAQEASQAPSPETPPTQSLNPSLTLDGLLEAVKRGRLTDNKANQQRMREFIKAKAQQQQLLTQIIQTEKEIFTTR